MTYFPDVCVGVFVSLTYSDFDLRVIQNNVPHCHHCFSGAVVYEKGCQTNEVVLSECIFVLGVVQPQRNSHLWNKTVDKTQCFIMQIHI